MSKTTEHTEILVHGANSVAAIFQAPALFLPFLAPTDSGNPCRNDEGQDQNDYV